MVTDVLESVVTCCDAVSGFYTLPGVEKAEPHLSYELFSLVTNK